MTVLRDSASKVCAVDAWNGPKTPDRRRYAYNESADEPASLIESEPVDVEREAPSDDTEAVEDRVKDQPADKPSGFEE